MLHNAPSLDLSSMILFWKKSRKIDNVNWIDIELIWNLIFPFRTIINIFIQVILTNVITYYCDTKNNCGTKKISLHFF